MTCWLNKLVFSLIGIFICLLAARASPAKDTKKGVKEANQAVASSTDFTLKIPVDVVVVSASATGKDGRPVKDLTINDFKVYEDGKLQPIHTFSLESFKSMQEGAPTQAIPAQAPVAGERAAPSRARYFCLMVDDLSIYQQSMFYYVFTAMRKFIENDLLPGDQVSIVSVSGSVQAPFTSDKLQLLANLKEAERKRNLRVPYRSTCPALTDLQAQQIANSIDVSTVFLNVAIQETMVCAHLDGPGSQQIAAQIVRTNGNSQYMETKYRNMNILRELRQYVRSLRHFEGQKTIMLFSGGFLSDELRYEIQQVVDNALRAGVIINTLDARGLEVDGIYSAETSGGMPTMVMSQKPMVASLSQAAEEAPLATLANDTGGAFFYNNNDLHAGLKKFYDRETYYYVLTYATPNAAADGRYHKIKLEASRPGLKLNYRQGYFAPQEEVSYERRVKEDIWEGLSAPGNLDEIPLRLSYNYSQMDDARYQLDLLAEIDLRPLKFQEEESRHKNQMHLVLVIFDENDRFIDGLEKAMEFNLSDASFDSLRKTRLQSKWEVQVPPGHYKIKAVVREAHRSKMGSAAESVDVP